MGEDKPESPGCSSAHRGIRQAVVSNTCWQRQSYTYYIPFHSLYLTSICPYLPSFWSEFNSSARWGLPTCTVPSQHPFFLKLQALMITLTWIYPNNIGYLRKKHNSFGGLFVPRDWYTSPVSVQCKGRKVALSVLRLWEKSPWLAGLTLKTPMGPPARGMKQRFKSIERERGLRSTVQIS